MKTMVERSHRSGRGLPWAACLLLAGGILAGPAPGAPYLPHPVGPGEAPPVVDGSLDDGIWSRADAITDFRQRDPDEGASPTESTHVRLVYTPTDLYVGVGCLDSRPDAIVSSTRRRDDFSLTGDDQFVVAIDSFGEGRDGFFFSTNPLGVRVDARFFDEGDVFVDGWNEAWDVRTSRDARGWSAELRIPFRTLRFRRAPGNSMGVNLFRRIIRSNETLFSPLIPRERAGGTASVSLAREVRFEGIVPGSGVRVDPFVTVRRESRGADAEASARLGADLRWTASGALSANLSVNTDFAQAEADDRRINLTRFALFVPEKRDFFLENAGLFAFGAPSEAEVFFSRRIGYVDGAQEGSGEVPIRVGGKVGGRTARHEYGALYVRTGDALGAAAEGFAVLRARTQLTRRSWLGAILTSREGEPDLAGSVAGLDGVFRGAGEVTVSAFVAGSRATSARTGTGAASRIRIERGGDGTAFHLEFLDLGARFAPPTGFVARPSSRTYRAGGARPIQRHSGPLRRVAPSVAFERIEDRGGAFLDDFHRVTLGVEATSGDAGSLFLERIRARLEESFALPGDVPVRAGDHRELRGGGEVRTKAGRPVSARCALDTGGFYGGARTTVSAGVTAKARGRLRAGPEFERSWIRIDGASAEPFVLRLRTELDVDVDRSVTGFLQYDSESRRVGWRAQLHALRGEAQEAYLILGRDTVASPGAGAESWLLLKVTARIDL